METAIKRPGGELATRPLHFFWIVDCSGSMMGEKIGTVNNAIQTVIPEMANEARDNPNAQLIIRTLKFSSGAEWITETPTAVEDYAWNDLQASGVTDMGAAFNMLCAELEMPPMPERALPPVLVLLSDGAPTDDYRTALDRLLSMPWGKKAVRIAISIGSDADDSMLAQFASAPELVLQANSAQALVKMIKWASTAASQVSAPASRPAASRPRNAIDDAFDMPEAPPPPLIIDMNTIPDIDDNAVW